MSRDSLAYILEVGAGSSDITNRAVDVYIRRARLSFETIDPSFDQIETVRGLGYRWQMKDVDGRRINDPRLSVGTDTELLDQTGEVHFGPRSTSEFNRPWKDAA
jgi:hypothetical protein